jgi:hypothetical protein
MSSYIQIGSGFVYVNPTAGNLTANPTPRQGFTIQSCSLDMKGTVQTLKGQYQFPDDTAVTDKTCTGKFQIGRKDLSMLNEVFFADIVTAGGVSVSPNEAHMVPASTAFTVTVTPPGSGTFTEDLGVSYAADPATGAFQRVSTLTAVGQYTVSAGVYTFFSADASANVLISYGYSLTAPGSLFQVNNQVIGYAPQVEVFIVDTYQPKLVSGKNVYPTIKCYAAKFTDLSNLGNTRDKYSMPELSFECFASPSGRVLDMYSPY